MTSSPVPVHRRPAFLALVAAGGAVGAAARQGIGDLWSQHGEYAWPVLLVNCVGALVLGALLEALGRLGPDDGARRRVRLVAGVGFCGAFTTYSTFAHDVVTLSHHGLVRGICWGVGEVALGCCFAAFGMWCGARWAIARVGEPGGEAVRP